MPSNWAKHKRSVRKAAHAAFCVDVLYKVDSESDFVQTTARWHEKLVRQGQMEGQGAEVYEGIDKVVFDKEANLALVDIDGNPTPLTPQRGALITFPDYNLTVILDTEIPADGPVEEIWLVSRYAE